MPRTITRKSPRTANGRSTLDLVRATGNDIRRQREDAGISQRRLAAVAGVDHGFLSQVERGLREPSLAVLVAIAEALGGNLRVRIHPGTGPRIRDPIQSKMVEAFLQMVDPRWHRLLEVPVYRPVRGVIDVVLHETTPPVVVATEAQSELRRIEQLIRWSHEKSDALPSASFWSGAIGHADIQVDRLLLIRSTHTNRRVVAGLVETLTHEYPARAQDAYAALTTADAPWPGSAIVWMEVDGETARLLPRPPRGVRLGV